ncbi:MAG: hypothetical protein NZ805_12840 [Armatimonadetes bacterium]|nr:hypothetical protein [Armatimonadota bacterium]MDW8027213.1 hypothetical protein [Armatimonadota bacterium]
MENSTIGKFAAYPIEPEPSNQKPNIKEAAIKQFPSHQTQI